MSLSFTQLKSASVIIFTSVDKQTLCKCHVNYSQIFDETNELLNVKKTEKSIDWLAFCLHCM